ncbi:SGNH/GDSL hydrolase family protein [Streptomyces olivaceiscleroticus]|uniref:SGNH hydrolase-type esterase domain-containing protein n=1 Tax=Streptomyces olivaceiscleroticus TaxID=68245 RepID=A0ABN1AKB1_9ACTN
MRVRQWGTTVPLALALTVAGTAVPATAAGPQAATAPQPLARLFDNTAVSDDTRAGGADFDGAGNSLSAQDLAAAGWTPGRSLELDATRLTWPHTAPGRPDNVRADGQAVRLSGPGTALTFLVAATGGDVTGTGTVQYRDGSRSAYELTAPDWRTGPLSTKAVALPHTNSAAGQRTEAVRLYAVTVPVRPGRQVRSVVLPKDPGPDRDLHVFSAALRRDTPGWTGSWAASSAGYTKVGPWRDQTLRLVVHAGAGGRQARIRLENTFAATPVDIGAASVAVQRDGAQAVGKPVPLTFGGKRATRIPAGAQAFSDPVRFTVPADTNLLVSFHLAGPVGAAPVHKEAIQRSYVSATGSGDRTRDAGAAAYTGTLTTWPFLSGVDVTGGPGSIVALGDSITDGVKSTQGANRRWPDTLARRFQNQTALPKYGVINHGISANRIVTDRYKGDGISTDTGGVSAQHRLERDVLAQTSARTVVVFEGINDVRSGTSAAEVIEGLRNIARRAHERGLRVVAATVAPCEGYPDCYPEVDQRRQAVNAFIRDSGGAVDAVLDFDAVIRDPQRPQRMLPAYDSGDHLHPGDEGLKALAESVELRKLVP